MGCAISDHAQSLDGDQDLGRIEEIHSVAIVSQPFQVCQCLFDAFSLLCQFSFWPVYMLYSLPLTSSDPVHDYLDLPILVRFILHTFNLKHLHSTHSVCLLDLGHISRRSPHLPRGVGLLHLQHLHLLSVRPQSHTSQQ